MGKVFYDGVRMRERHPGERKSYSSLLVFLRLFAIPILLLVAMLRRREAPMK